MGLDACVFCDCLEKGHLRKQLPADFIIKVEANGMPCITRDGEVIWDEDSAAVDFACEHEGRILIRHGIGNMALVALLRWELKREEASYPLLLNKVVYNGIHGGDWLGLNQIPQLQAELELLKHFKCVGDAPTSFSWSRVPPEKIVQTQDCSTAEESNRYMQNFRTQMVELTETAIRVQKPISF